MSRARPSATSTVRGLEQRLLRRVREVRLAAGATIAVAFSGGTDSLALLAALSRTQQRSGPALLAVHIDHALRVESAAEAMRAGALAATLDVPFRCLRLAGVVQRHPGVGVEEAARRERYLALAAVMEDERAALLAVGHQRDDHAETVLLHLLRGAGPAGIAGMTERSVLPVPWWPGAPEPIRALEIWRPLLGETPETLRHYVEGLGLVPVEDASNDDPVFRRNAVRHQVLPLLERLQPGATAALGRYANIAGEEDRLLASYAEAAWHRVWSDDALSASRLAEEPLALARRIIKRWLTDAIGAAPSADRVDAVLDLVRCKAGRRCVEVGACRVVWVEEGGVRIGVTNQAAELRPGH
ncbi:MAG: tRNA(Ile)-lysidine synthetase [uncultured Thermomicrobiales bacterium]|uniref:tRNA(Ile)-lysidine synthase n=1 Tax=uncultured Thermomicrobiales bacterium TaxID=1645740 RepID=A0A6J4UMM1_9BACT|nr:MAG: tRNA(Ile)-lysidine synthetase [uncultured Thermomicrobiales bacterium]